MKLRNLGWVGGQVGGGYHFVEILQMRELEAEGLAWEYETYSLFELPKPGQSPGHAQIAAAYPPEALRRLQEAGKRRQPPR